MTRSSVALGVALPLLAFIALTSLVIARPGFTPDEEITAVLASAIGSRGLPILPSGVLYPRGVPYLYAAWVVSLGVGKTMLAWRLTSWIFGAIGIVVSYRLGARIGGQAVALFLSLLLATFPPYVAAAVFARPYTALIACVLLFLYWMLPPYDSPRWKPAAALACAVWLHPVGIALSVLPALCAFAYRGNPAPSNAADARSFGQRGRDRVGGGRASVAMLTLTLVAVGVASAGLAYGAHAVSLWTAGVSPTNATAVYAIPTGAWPASSHITALAGLPAWLIAVVLFAALGFILLLRYPDATALVAISLAFGIRDQLGLLLLTGASALAWNPAGARRTATVVMVAAGAAIAFWTVHTASATHAQLNWAFARSLATAAAGYPLGQLWYALGAFPVVAALAVAGTAWALSRPAPDEVHRLVAGIALLVLALLGAYAILGVAVAERYLLLPWTLLAILASAGVGAIVAGLRGRIGSGALGIAHPAFTATTAAVVGAAIAAVWVGGASYARERDALVAVPMAEQAFAPLTGPSWTPELLQSEVQPDDLLICTEELACAYLLGRVDFLFALPPRDVAHYVVDRGGAAAGFYAGAPVLSSAADLQRAIQDYDRTGCAAVVALKSGKVGYDEYLAVVDGLRDSFDVRDVVSHEDLHVSRVCRSFVNAWLMPRRVP